jgi:hypothetical protein
MSLKLDQPFEHENWRPLLLSLLTHGMILALLLFALRPAGAGGKGQPDRRVEVVLSLADANTQEYLTETDSKQVVEQTNQSAAAPPSLAADQQPPPIDIPELAELAGPIVPTETGQLDASQMAEVPFSSGLNTEFELSREDLKMIADEQRRLKAQQPVGNPASISVFGSGQLVGRRFVFVLDRSQSMGAGGLGVIDRARTELTHAIDQLDTNHSFQVVAYHDRTVTIDRRELLPATAQNKAMVPEFIGHLAAFGSTRHENGLTSALVFQPDVIVLLTDGGSPTLNGGQLEIVKLMAKGHTQIHCIQFGIGPLQTKDNFMMRIARQNNGTFQYIDVTKW